jgi:hypothetical protein
MQGANLAVPKMNPHKQCVARSCKNYPRLQDGRAGDRAAAIVHRVSIQLVACEILTSIVGLFEVAYTYNMDYPRLKSRHSDFPRLVHLYRTFLSLTDGVERGGACLSERARARVIR